MYMHQQNYPCLSATYSLILSDFVLYGLNSLRRSKPERTVTVQVFKTRRHSDASSSLSPLLVPGLL